MDSFLLMVQLTTLPCSSRRLRITMTIDTTSKGQQVYAGINNLFTEVIWWYPTANATFNG